MYKILITSSNQYNVLKKISLNLVNERLSPCTHIIKDVESFYIWDNTAVDSNENLLLVKCNNEDIEKIKTIIYSYHNYELPEIICHEFSIISEKYRKWFDKKN